MKRFLLQFLFLFTFFASYALTYEDENGVTWTYTVNTTYGYAYITKMSATGDAAINVVIPEKLPNSNGVSVPVNYLASNAIDSSNNNSTTSNPFYKNTTVETIKLPSTLKQINNYAFYGCTSLKSITIPDGVAAIGNYAFRDCSSLEEVSFGSGIASIGAFAFRYCSSLKEVSFGCGLASIENSAFQDCISLTNITLPSDLASLGSVCFDNCRLENIVVKGKTPPTIQTSTFSNQVYYHAVLYVLADSYKDYIFDANWYKFINVKKITESPASVAENRVYRLMNSTNSGYLVYDEINNTITTLTDATDAEEINANNSWMLVEYNGQTYLYNVGAKKFAVVEDGVIRLVEDVDSINIEQGKNGVSFKESNGSEWYFVENGQLNADENVKKVIASATGIEEITEESVNTEIYSLDGTKQSSLKPGVSVVKSKDGKAKKVIIK